MKEPPVFGLPQRNGFYTDRRAAYVVVIHDGMVAMVRPQEKCFLPGGGSLPGEAPEDTVVREVREEVRRGVRLIRRIGEAVQYFYSSTDDQHYRMTAVFFAGEFMDDPCGGRGEHELEWLPVTETEEACFHACHAWAVRQA
jgi:8-oxo-dGTP pyrophosphatase MutT (NUDIX family)